jgi:hypothetical protein
MRSLTRKLARAHSPRRTLSLTCSSMLLLSAIVAPAAAGQPMEFTVKGVLNLDREVASTSLAHRDAGSRAVEDSIYFHEGRVKCTIFMRPIQVEHESDVRRFTWVRVHTTCRQAHPPYQNYPVNFVRLRLTYEVERREHVGGGRVVVCRENRGRSNRAFVKRSCSYSAYIIEECRMHAYARTWVTENNVTKRSRIVSRHRSIAVCSP